MMMISKRSSGPSLVLRYLKVQTTMVYFLLFDICFASSRYQQNSTIKALESKNLPQNLLNNDRIARSCFFMLKNTTDWVETYTGKRKPKFKGGDASRAGACQKSVHVYVMKALVSQAKVRFPYCSRQGLVNINGNTGP